MEFQLIQIIINLLAKSQTNIKLLNKRLKVEQNSLIKN